jgi:hypothetical protein
MNISKLREILSYTFKKMPIVFLIEIWTLTRALTILITVGIIIIDGYLRNNSDVCVLTLFK